MTAQLQWLYSINCGKVNTTTVDERWNKANVNRHHLDEVTVRCDKNILYMCNGKVPCTLKWSQLIHFTFRDTVSNILGNSFVQFLQKAQINYISAVFFSLKFK